MLFQIRVDIFYFIRGGRGVWEIVLDLLLQCLQDLFGGVFGGGRCGSKGQAGGCVNQSG